MKKIFITFCGLLGIAFFLAFFIVAVLAEAEVAWCQELFQWKNAFVIPIGFFLMYIFLKSDE